MIRTGFELQLNLMYMLQTDKDFEERCLAYEYFHWLKQLKVARDPFNPTTERQLLLVVVVSVAFLTWRFWSERQA